MTPKFRSYENFCLLPEEVIFINFVVNWEIKNLFQKFPNSYPFHQKFVISEL